jgi:hypothetical protein
VLGKKVGAGVLVGIATLALSVPVSASGATTIGQTFIPTTEPNTELCVGPITFLQSSSPQSSYAVPSSGVLTSWSYQASGTVSPIKFKLGRRVSGDSFRVEAESALVTPATNTVNTYPVRATVAPGDVIGIHFTGTAGCTRITPGYEDHYYGGDVLPGTAPLFILDDGSYQFDVSAQLEPDADGDGFGDETQDSCPTDPSKQDCIAPETRLTKDAPKTTDKSKVKFKFAADAADSTFECKADKKPYSPCSSPRTVKNLDQGKHTFKVRAIDAAGNVDPSPAKDKFKVVD